MDLFRFRSKTDAAVVLICGVSGVYVDPVSKLRKYLTLRGETDESKPLWVWKNGKVVTPNSVLSVIKGQMLWNKIDPSEFYKISFRAGGA